MEDDLLVNHKISGLPDLETVDIKLDDISASISAPAPEAPAPRLVPSFEESGPTNMNGFSNFNAETYAPRSMTRMSDEAVQREKYEILRKFERLSKLGVPMRKRFTIDSPLDEMKMELEFIKREKSMDSTIKQFSEWFVTGMAGMEWGSKNIALMKAFGLQLDGLSEAAQMNVVDLEDDFEELYEMYGENLKMHPFVRIPLRTCMMIYMVHLTNQMVQKAPVPDIQNIMRQNPDIARQLATGAMQQQTQQMRGSATMSMPVQPPPVPQMNANPLAGLSSFLSQTMPPAPPPNVIPKPPAENKAVRIGVAPKKSAPPPAPAPAPAPTLKGPSMNLDDLLKDIRGSVSTPAPPPVPAPAPPSTPKSAMRKAGSTGKNSVVIKL